MEHLLLEEQPGSSMRNDSSPVTGNSVNEGEFELAGYAGGENNLERIWSFIHGKDGKVQLLC